MALKTLLRCIVSELAREDGKSAIKVLEEMQLEPEMFDECLGQLVCLWMTDEAEFSWSAHFAGESADFIVFQLDLVDLDEDERKQINFWILVSGRLVSSKSNLRLAGGLESLLRAIEKYLRNS